MTLNGVMAVILDYYTEGFKILMLTVSDWLKIHTVCKKM